MPSCPPQAVASEEDCSDGKTAADHEHTPKLDETDDEFEEVADLPSTAVLPDEGSAEVTQQPNQDVTVQSPDSLVRTFLKGSFLVFVGWRAQGAQKWQPMFVAKCDKHWGSGVVMLGITGTVLEIFVGLPRVLWHCERVRRSTTATNLL